MSLITEFKINGLNQNYDVDLIFENNKTIFIGENGIGKTTILSILYYILDLNFAELLRYSFYSIELTFEDPVPLAISKHDIREELERLQRSEARRRSPRSQIDINEFVRKIEEDREFSEELKKIIASSTSNSNSYREVMNILRNKTGFGPSSIRFREEVFSELSYRLNPPSYKLLIDKVENIKNNYKILYFPTYRRIEENLAQLDLKTRDERFRNKSNGELIHFGMEDVKQKIANLLNKISKETNESYNTMTSGLLNKFAEGNLDVSFEEFDKDMIGIALSRLGNKVTEKSKETILKKIENNTIKDDKHLNYLVSSIIENYKQLEEIDSRIDDFTERVNKYLFNKKFFYDAESLKLEIKRTNLIGEIKTHRSFFGDDVEEVINLESLSSGEKQLVSAFSKIFLEDEKKLLILFDEPELSLSVPWQKEFIHDISQAGTCKFLLVVTHSPFIFDQLLDYARDIDKFITETDKFTDEVVGNTLDWDDSIIDDVIF
ncbi:ATP-binding protein [Streptococcus anginosus]|uniref:AAA ATPase domain protein n=1 Tax=Streptococcus anginosus SK1138 TaxID=1161422 RepID=A0AAD2YAG1_STRAP|nr:AAA family ATPase [Streptococcus anginosus]EJP26362.1 AAA ATPase domain protein [Streptococcus anginosus SK1138]MCY7222956.1 ATP-binding protein [Streptococcus anginosus]RIB35791.1 ATP-binding protein [Streptococcus anginosus]